MTQADSVLSTPRRTAPKSTGCLEGKICDCLHMAELAAMVVDQTMSDRNRPIDGDETSTVMFAVYQLKEMIGDVHRQFYADLELGRGKAVAR